MRRPPRWTFSSPSITTVRRKRPGSRGSIAPLPLLPATTAATPSTPEGPNCYFSYDSVFTDSSAGGCWAPANAISQLAAYGVPPSVVVLAKPMLPGDNPDGSSLVTPYVLAEWVARARLSGLWTAGVVAWQFSPEYGGDWLAAIYPASVTKAVTAVGPAMIEPLTCDVPPPGPSASPVPPGAAAAASTASSVPWAAIGGALGGVGGLLLLLVLCAATFCQGEPAAAAAGTADKHTPEQHASSDAVSVPVQLPPAPPGSASGQGKDPSSEEDGGRPAAAARPSAEQQQQQIRRAAAAAGSSSRHGIPAAPRGEVDADFDSVVSAAPQPDRATPDLPPGVAYVGGYSGSDALHRSSGGAGRRSGGERFTYAPSGSPTAAAARLREDESFGGAPPRAASPRTPGGGRRTPRASTAGRHSTADSAAGSVESLPQQTDEYPPPQGRRRPSVAAASGTPRPRSRLNQVQQAQYADPYAASRASPARGPSPYYAPPLPPSPVVWGAGDQAPASSAAPPPSAWQHRPPQVPAYSASGRQSKPSVGAAASASSPAAPVPRRRSAMDFAAPVVMTAGRAPLVNDGAGEGRY